MLSIGLTGSLGTGKSTVAAMFKKHGARVVDADRIAHNLIRRNGKCYKAVIKAFGTADRKKLAAIVFESNRKRRKLESVIHPEVRRELKKRLGRYSKNPRCRAVVVEVPLLFESGMHRLMNINIVVKASQGQQLERVQRTRRIQKKEALKRIRAQWSITRKIRMADYVIDNRGSKAKTRTQVQTVWNNIIDSNLKKK